MEKIIYDSYTSQPKDITDIVADYVTGMIRYDKQLIIDEIYTILEENKPKNPLFDIDINGKEGIILALYDKLVGSVSTTFVMFKSYPLLCFGKRTQVRLFHHKRSENDYDFLLKVIDVYMKKHPIIVEKYDGMLYMGELYRERNNLIKNLDHINIKTYVKLRDKVKELFCK